MEKNVVRYKGKTDVQENNNYDFHNYMYCSNEKQKYIIVSKV